MNAAYLEAIKHPIHFLGVHAQVAFGQRHDAGVWCRSLLVVVHRVGGVARCECVLMGRPSRLMLYKTDAIVESRLRPCCLCRSKWIVLRRQCVNGVESRVSFV